MSNDDAATYRAATPQAPGWPPAQAGHAQQQPGYGYPPPGYVARPKKPYAAALVLAAVGFVLEAIASFLYWPSDSYSLTMTRIATVASGLGYLLLAVAAFVASLRPFVDDEPGFR